MHPDLKYVGEKDLSMTLSLEVFINSPHPLPLLYSLETLSPEFYAHDHKTWNKSKAAVMDGLFQKN